MSLRLPNALSRAYSHSKEIAPPEIQATRPSHSLVNLPKLSEEVMTELFKNPMPTIPKIAAKSSTWNLLGQILNAALLLASDGDWDWLFAVPQLLLWRPAAQFTAGHIARHFRVLLSGNISSLVEEWQSGNKQRGSANKSGLGHTAATRSNDKIRSAAMSALCQRFSTFVW